MKTKLFTLSLALVANIYTLLASNTSVGDIYYYFNGNTRTAEVTYKGDYYNSYSNWYSGDIIIPSSVEYNGTTYTVTSIGNNAFNHSTGLTSVAIPNTVTRIGQWAFYHCIGLKNVTLSNSITNIEDRAFSECYRLTSIEIPNSIISIGNYVFCNDSSLTNVTIPNSVTKINIGTFAGCSGLTSITIPYNITSIGFGAFYRCTGLTSVAIPYSVTYIEDGVFADCSGLTSIVVENGNSVYDSRDNCNAIIETATNMLVCGIQNTTIPNSVISIGYGAFHGISSLTSITIPNSVTNIGPVAFAECSNLTSITCEAVTPPGCEDHFVFSNVNKSIPLYVPANSVNDYKSAYVWNEFTNINPIQESVGIEQTTFESSRSFKFDINGQIIILRGDKTYTLTGQEIR